MLYARRNFVLTITTKIRNDDYLISTNQNVSFATNQRQSQSTTIVEKPRYGTNTCQKVNQKINCRYTVVLKLQLPLSSKNDP